mgnify:CR=1 FL=1
MLLILHTLLLLRHIYQIYYLLTSRIFNTYSLKINRAVLSGICASPTELDTVIKRFPRNVPWSKF